MLRHLFASTRFLAILLLAAGASAQDLDLATNGAEVRWRGTAAGAQAGTYLDHGTMSADARRDLIVGAPATGSAARGHVYIFFGGPVPPAGEHPLSAAHVVFTGAANGDGFGTSGAAANVLNPEGTDPRNLLVGAPLAGGESRGMVYLFTTNFVGGESVTTAAAAMTVRGAPGDRLGSALASADLDFDGYREIIAGAPGNNRVYVIWGGPGLAGQTRDMASTGADGPDITIWGQGIGNVLTAGAFTGDSVYDLFIGAPSVNLVYMIQGLGTRDYQKNMIVQRDETSYFLGVNGDGAGASLRMGDFDGDRRADLLIGAPNAGPSLQGAAYILWGRKPGEATPGSIVLSQADVIFQGPFANARLGQMAAGGSINRDGEDDVALVAPGATTGGAVYVFYGRERAAYGVLQSSGNRIVSFADPAHTSLRVLGDASAGAIATVFVYEVTGEGARDLIVGTPQATTSAGANSGRLYFAISPRMVLSPHPVVATVVQGATSQRSLAVTNASPTAITFSVAPQSPWLTLSPLSGSAVSSAPGALTLGIAGAGLNPGDHLGHFQVRSTSEHIEMAYSAEVRLTVITQPTVSANTTFPAIAGTPITWTAASTGGAAGLLYQFFRLDADGWHMVRDWSASPTYTWTPSAAGEHAVQVWVKTPASTSLYDAYAATPVFRIDKAVPRITSFTNNGTYPLAPNTPVQFNVTATGGTAALQYRFLLYREGVGWSVLQEYGSASQATWTPAASGSYAVQVWVRSTGVPEQYEAWSSSGMLTVSTTAPVTVHSLSADKPYPLKAGETVTFTATASGGSAGPLQFQFVRYDESTGTWTIVQPYSASRSYSWATGASSVGNHVLQVWVRSLGSSAVYQAWGTSGMFAVTMEPLSAPRLSASVVFPVPAPTPVKWTVHASGGVAPLQYQFWLYTQGQGWTMARDYSTSNSFTWTPPANGTYVMQAYVRHAGSSTQYDAWATSGFFEVAGGAPAQAVSITADRAFPVAAGQAITWTGVATRGTAGPLQYRFILLNQGTGAWSVLQEYSTANTVTWTTAPNNQGTYLIQMWVRSAGSSAQYEGWISTGSFTIQ